MKKTLVLMLALVCLFFATGCGTAANDDSIDETAFTVTLDTTSGSAIPAQFNADVTWKIRDSDWKAGDVYEAQAYFAGTGGTPIELGSPLAFESAQSGTTKYAFKIPDDGLPSTVKKPYELTIVVTKADAQVYTSAPWTFTEGKISGVYTGELNYYSIPDPVTSDDVEYYDYKVTLTQYGNLVVGTNIFWLKSATESVPQICTVLLTASTDAGKTKLTGTGTYTNKDKETYTYSGDIYVYGDGRTLSCDSYWLATDTTKKKCGSFDANQMGTASISGKVTIDSAVSPIFDSTVPEDEDTCYVVVLYGFGESSLENNAGRMYMGPVEKSGSDYFFTYKIEDLPAGNYYLMFGGIDGETATPEAERDHMPWSTGEAVGLDGLAPALAVKWIDGITLTGTDKTAFDALVPVTVTAGQAVTGKDFNAVVRSTDK